MARIVFYCNDQKENISIFEYYLQDIRALESIGHEVIICTKYREIPLRFDFIYIWWWTYAFLPVVYAKIIGAKSIITGAFNFKFPDTFSGIDYFRRPFYQRFLIFAATKIANVNIFINDFEEKACKDYFSLKQTYVSPCVVGDDYYLEPNAERESFLFNICWSGYDNLHRKGIPELLKSIKILKERGLNLKIKLAGKEGDGFEWLNNYIDELEIRDSVELIGKITTDEKIHLLSKCFIYVQPSHYEGFGLGIAEAMSAACSVITCDVGAVKSVVGNAGIYCESNNSLDLADKIEKLCIDNELRIKIQVEAHTRAKSHFTSDTKIELLKEIILRNN